ncbi:MAG TPA: HD domain-containing protein [Thermoplasmata archaeon]|nr:HD domain-containing protein [Thermoplasmata archaeon]
MDRAPRRKTIFDPIHGAIALQGAALDLANHPAFQRLWGVRQTGFAHLVFPGANHTRLEHSLGVYGVARQIAESLALEERAAETLCAGALLHDLGHGPFSHTLEPSMRELLGHGHEGISRAWIVDSERPFPRGPGDDGQGPTIPEVLERQGLVPREVAELVDPTGTLVRPPLLRPLLHGAIDADRIDYLQRDAHYTGVAHGVIDGVRLRETIQEYRGRLVFAEKGRTAVEGFLVGRALMYSAVYYHKTVRAAEVMAQSAVERLPAYPELGPALFGLSDGDLLARLGAAGGRARTLVGDLLGRRLHKRAWGERRLEPSTRRRWDRLARAPGLRRDLEDRLSEAIGAPPGSVLLDLAGVAHRAPADEAWGDVAIREDDRLVYPFRRPGPWTDLALRPPTLWAVSAYVPASLAARAHRRLGPAVRRHLP